MADREPRNKNRLDLYRKLLQKIIESDQNSGAQGYIAHWDDPDATWDSGDVSQVWDAIGLSPVIQELFHVIETMEGENLEAIESLDSYTDPLSCPASVLPLISASFGYNLDETQSEERQRLAVHGLMEAYKSKGMFAGFKVFYRLLGFQVINVYPLWKKEINEERNDYSRERYRTTGVVNEPIGPAGLSGFAGRVSQGPVKPGTVRFTDGTIVLRDDVQRQPELADDLAGYGDIIGPTTESGTFHYATGEFTINLAAPAAGPFAVDYERIDEEWPYHAARIDIELNLSPGGVPVPLIDLENSEEILRRLDEIRPIHVLLRVLALVTELRDEFSPGASDQTACATKLKNELEGVEFPGIPGLDHSYFLDGALAFSGPAGGDELSIFIEHNPPGPTDEHRQLLDDDAPLVCPLDALVIDSRPGQPGPPGGPIYA